MIKRKKDSDYSPHERDLMKNYVLNANRKEIVPPHYAGAFLGKTTRCLQDWRSNKSDMLPFHKLGHSIGYMVADLHNFAHNNKFLCTANYKAG